MSYTEYLTVFPRVNLLENPSCLLKTTFRNYNRKDIIQNNLTQNY